MIWIVFLAAGMALVVLLRARLGHLADRWRVAVGLAAGALVGVVWSVLLARVGGASGVAAAMGLPWPVCVLVFVVLGALMMAGPVREALERLFPRRTRGSSRGRDDEAG